MTEKTPAEIKVIRKIWKKQNLHIGEIGRERVFNAMRQCLELGKGNVKFWQEACLENAEEIIKLKQQLSNKEKEIIEKIEEKFNALKTRFCIKIIIDKRGYCDKCLSCNTIENMKEELIKEIEEGKK